MANIMMVTISAKNARTTAPNVQISSAFVHNVMTKPSTRHLWSRKASAFAIVIRRLATLVLVKSPLTVV